MIINLSNHPSSLWKDEQIDAASQYGEIVDIPFPQVPPEWDDEQVKELAVKYFHTCMERINDKPSVVHLAGESVFCFFLLQYLLREGIECLTSTTERIVNNKDGVKESVFKFKRFRNYKLI